jgi:tripartite-type tricarboxylate transporter receptor subunit TctC
MLHVPYKSAGLATSAVLSGEAQVLLTNMASVLPHLSSGKLKAMGVSSLKRSDAAPQVPTLSESGLPQFEYVTWYGMLAPARTQPSLLDRMHTSVAHVIKEPDTAVLFARQGLQTYGSSPAEFDHYLRSEIERWTKVVAAAQIRVD